MHGPASLLEGRVGERRHVRMIADAGSGGKPRALAEPAT
jgi:hypothetical protein